MVTFHYCKLWPKAAGFYAVAYDVAAGAWEGFAATGSNIGWEAEAV
ncbi:MAG: hypothetical protein U5K75_09580 [Ahrensia sp.]|nr:hypothetical protein [Ahrensia sp.]